jgi:hypothetical protein
MLLLPLLGVSSAWQQQFCCLPLLLLLLLVLVVPTVGLSLWKAGLRDTWRVD